MKFLLLLSFRFVLLALRDAKLKIKRAYITQRRIYLFFFSPNNLRYCLCSKAPRTNKFELTHISPLPGSNLCPKSISISRPSHMDVVSVNIINQTSDPDNVTSSRISFSLHEWLTYWARFSMYVGAIHNPLFGIFRIYCVIFTSNW